MRYRQFLTYNVVGAVVWVVSFLALGYLFGNQPAVKKNFTLVIAAIIVISAVPAVIEMVKARREL
jgi:membrane-associated protein